MANAIGMVFLLTGLGFTVVSVTSKSNKVRFGRLFRIYALSSGVTLLISWVRHFWSILRSGNGG